MKTYRDLQFWQKNFVSRLSGRLLGFVT